MCAGCSEMKKNLAALHDDIRAVRSDVADVRLQLTDIKPLIDMAKAYVGGTSGKLLGALMKGKQRGT